MSKAENKTIKNSHLELLSRGMRVKLLKKMDAKSSVRSVSSEFKEKSEASKFRLRMAEVNTSCLQVNRKVINFEAPSDLR